MEKNIGKKDRLIRLGIAAILFSMAWWLKSWVLFACGLFTLYEAVASWCLLYHLMGKNTCPVR